jgi:hypothetical protein
MLNIHTGRSAVSSRKSEESYIDVCLFPESKVKVKLSVCLTKYHAMKAPMYLIKHHAMKT